MKLDSKKSEIIRKTKNKAKTFQLYALEIDLIFFLSGETLFEEHNEILYLIVLTLRMISQTHDCKLLLIKGSIHQ